MPITWTVNDELQSLAAIRSYLQYGRGMITFGALAAAEAGTTNNNPGWILPREAAVEGVTEDVHLRAREAL